MPNKCCVPGCRSNYDKSDPSITVFSFPKDLIRAEIWLQAIHRSDYQLSKFSRVCIKHFDERFIVREDIATRPDGSVLVVKIDHLKLTDDAIPTIVDNLPSYLSKKLSSQRKPPAQRQLEHEKRIEENKQDEESMDKISSYEELKNDLTVKSDLELENFRMNDMENIEDEPEGFTTIFIKEERIPPDDEFSEDVEVDDDIAVVEASDPFQLNEGCSSASRESDIEISAPSSCVEQGVKSEQCEELNSSDPLSKNIDVLSATGNCSVCSFCDERFHSKFDLKEHITIHTGQHTEKKPYECDFCGKSFTYPSKLNYHMRTHTGEVCYKCEFCGKMFSLKSVHKNHVNVCSKQEIVLKNHITRMHTAIRSFKCHFCNKSFINMDTLLHHTRTHSGEKPHKCEYCNKCFSNQTHLSDHKTNTGKKPYKCEFCGKSFTYKSTLDRHIRTHSGEKPCNCLFCGKSFTRKSGLTAHMRTHGVKPSYKCEFCGQSFPNNSAFNEHITTHTL